MIHLGYLSFDRVKSECYIPNYEVAGEMVNAVKSNKWDIVADALDKSSQYDGQIILVGINYDSKSKKHDCKIEIYGDLTHRF